MIRTYYKKLIKLKLDLDGMNRPKVLEWWVKEVFRRNNIDPKMYCNTTLLSYPRSGNHAVRYMLEYSTNRPTLGANDRENKIAPTWMIDKPIFLRRGGENITINNLYPICIKRHSTSDIYDREFLIFLIRNPVEAILSHSRHLKDDNFKLSVSTDLANWLNLAKEYVKFPKTKKILVQYKNIIHNPYDTKKYILDFFNNIGILNDHKQLVSNKLMIKSKDTLQRKSISMNSLTYYSKRFPTRAAILNQLLHEEDFNYNEFVARYK